MSDQTHHIDRRTAAALLKEAGNDPRKIQIADGVVGNVEAKARRPKTNSVPVGEWVAQIDALMARMDDLAKQRQATVCEIGDLLIKAKKKLSKTDFAAVIKQSGLKS